MDSQMNLEDWRVFLASEARRELARTHDPKPDPRGRADKRKKWALKFAQALRNQWGTNARHHWRTRFIATHHNAETAFSLGPWRLYATEEDDVTKLPRSGVYKTEGPYFRLVAERLGPDGNVVDTDSLAQATFEARYL